MKTDVISHYDSLIDENNDPLNDPEPLKQYMDRWDGKRFIECLSLNENKTVLEIGVGTGRIAARVAPYCKSFSGIDISPKTVDRARQNLSAIPNVTLILGDFCGYCFSDSYDAVYSSLTFMHIKNKQKAINKAYQLLNGKGVFVLSISKDQERFIKYGDREIEIYPDELEKTKQRLKSAGFSIRKVIETDAAYVLHSEKP